MKHLDAKALTDILGQASREKKVIVQVSSIGYDDYWERVLELLQPYLAAPDLLAMLKDHLDDFSGDGYDKSDTADLIAKATLAK